jgi:hypothetical protein
MMRRQPGMPFDMFLGNVRAGNFRKLVEDLVT